MKKIKCYFVDSPVIFRERKKNAHQTRSFIPFVVYYLAFAGKNWQRRDKMNNITAEMIEKSSEKYMAQREREKDEKRNIGVVTKNYVQNTFNLICYDIR